jgi:hypothetical protein
MSYIEGRVNEILYKVEEDLSRLNLEEFKKYGLEKRHIQEMIIKNINVNVDMYKITQGDIEFSGIEVDNSGKIKIKAIVRKDGSFTLQDVDKIIGILSKERFNVFHYRIEFLLDHSDLYIEAFSMNTGKQIILSLLPFHRDNYRYLEVKYSLGTGNIIDNLCNELGIPLEPYIFEKKEK